MQEARLADNKQALREASAKAQQAAMCEATTRAREALKEAAATGRPQTVMRQEIEALKPDIMLLVYQQFTVKEIYEILKKSGFPHHYTVLRDAITRWRKEAGLSRKYRRDPRTPRPDTAQSSQDLTDRNEGN